MVASCLARSLAFAALAIHTTAFAAAHSAIARSCEPIRVELCRGHGYNLTALPNLAGHELQAEADRHLGTFAMLVQVGCSSQLLLFLCAVLVPMCTDKVPEPIGPCRGLCENVKTRCLPVLEGFELPWPPHMDCAKFPPHNSPAHMCMEGPKDAYLPPPSLPIIPQSVCPQPGQVYRGSRCVPRCDDVRFSRADKQMAEVWLSVWAGLCFVSSVLALLSLRLGPTPGQTQAPTRASWRTRGAEASPSPLASLVLSYAVLSMGWGVRALTGRGPVSCENAISGQAALRNPSCAMVFVLTYFFGTASVVWWVSLSAIWSLAAGLRVSVAALQRHSYLFHIAGWGVPAGLTVGVLVLRDVAADDLTGTCQVGSTWSSVFVTAPYTIALILGLFFLALGGLFLWKSRPTRPLQMPVWSLPADRLGLLCGLCGVPIGVLVGTHLMEVLAPHTAVLVVFQIRLLASLVIGVSAPVWVWPSSRSWPPPPCPPNIWKYSARGKCYPVRTSGHCVTGVPSALPLIHQTRIPSVPAVAVSANGRRTSTSSTGARKPSRSSTGKHWKRHGSETTV